MDEVQFENAPSAWNIAHDRFMHTTRMFTKKRKNWQGRKKPEKLKQNEQDLEKPEIPYNSQFNKYNQQEYDNVTTKYGVDIPTLDDSGIEWFNNSKLFNCQDCGKSYFNWCDHKKICKSKPPLNYYCQRCQVHDDIFSHECMVFCERCGDDKNIRSLLPCTVCRRSICPKCRIETDDAQQYYNHNCKEKCIKYTDKTPPPNYYIPKIEKRREDKRQKNLAKAKNAHERILVKLGGDLNLWRRQYKNV
jgi:hypothetical protein